MNADEIEIGKWYDTEPWYNERILESFISSDEVDVHGDRIKPSVFGEVMPFLAKFGYYEWEHSGFPIGKIIGWRFAKDDRDGQVKPQIRVGIHDSVMSKIPQHDEAWSNIKEFGLKGTSSINGFANLQRMVNEGGQSFNQIDDLGVFAVGWVWDDPANSGATLSFISQAKAKAREFQVQHMTKRISPGEDVSGEKTGGIGMDEQKLKSEMDVLRAEVQKSLDERDTRIAELEAKIKAEEDMDVPPPPPEDEIIEPGLDEVEGKIDTLAEAIEALAPGTPEAIEEAVALAESVKENSDYIEMMKSKDTGKKFSERIGKAVNRLTELRKSLVAKMSTPMTKSRSPVDKSQRIQKAEVLAKKSWDECEKAHNENKSAEWWKSHGFKRGKL